MSGDVFGNGMLLSRADQARSPPSIIATSSSIPIPMPKPRFAERERLFALPRSSWQDYDKTLISKGGGVFSRALKVDPADRPRCRRLTGLARQDSATPQELMHALLKAPADLLWFGGIGTYVQGSSETHADAGDRANDAHPRRCRPSSRSRSSARAPISASRSAAAIEFALQRRADQHRCDRQFGGRQFLRHRGQYQDRAWSRRKQRASSTRPERNRLLADMTDEVAGLVLRNNYLQTLCLSLALGAGHEEIGYAIQLMQQLESAGCSTASSRAAERLAASVERDAAKGGR